MKILYKTYKPGKDRRKQIELEESTGLKWDVYSTTSGQIFSAVITRTTTTDPELAKKLHPFVTRNGKSFVKLSELSGMSLADVLIAAKTLVKAQQANAGVNRMGHFASIYRKRS